MNRVSAAFGSIVFFFLAPGTVAGLVPWWISGWTAQPSALGGEPVRMAGVALISAGLIVLIDSFRRFAMEGLGTPAPVLPTKHLVVSGWYRHVRNPMYVAVISLILGQALLFADVRLLAYAAMVWFAFHVVVTQYEEPTLRQTFGEDYEVYCRAVGRWRPRAAPWQPKS
ncbi:MAG: isoprenylcysteine carboxylmethyltransferase family protein [Alphaproteobacteria bacterium]|nr:isoprenylcysteine carboxylmethyltransferase family protein [Alphaproteobacteria bacterium]